MNAVEIVTDLLQVIIGGLVLGAGLPARGPLRRRLRVVLRALPPEHALRRLRDARPGVRPLAGAPATA